MTIHDPSSGRDSELGGLLHQDIAHQTARMPRLVQITTKNQAFNTYADWQYVPVSSRKRSVL
jgi:hypothetical protein